MKLYDYMKLVDDDAEVTTWDKELDIEVYSYKSMLTDNSFYSFLTDKVKIISIKENGIEVNFYKYFEDNAEKSLKIYNEIFTNESNINDIAADWVELLENIFAGNISENAEKKIVELFNEQ